ncbi:MAG: mechanosensitive ion channel family protein [Chloroflexaceae bacterium]|nr:mechanosensitive ion channel family protein [Chloroflexaceae bacterium]
MVESLEAQFRFNLELLIPLVAFAATLIAGWFFDQIVGRGLRWFDRRSGQRIGGMLAEALQGKILTAFMLFGAWIAITTLFTTPGVTRFIGILITLLAVATFTLLAAQLATGFVNLSVGSGTVTSTSILNNVLRAIILTIGVVTAMSVMGIPINPLLGVIAGSSVGITLALQQPLTNLFAGIMLLATNKIEPGDYIRLASGEEGYVTDIQWHTTFIQLLTDNIIAVPNATIVSVILTNFDEPQKEMMIITGFAVRIESDLEYVEQVTIDVGREVMQQVAGGVSDFTPLVRYTGVQDYTVTYNVILRVQDFNSQFPVRHEFIKRLLHRYAQVGITPAFPVRGVFGYQLDGVAAQPFGPRELAPSYPEEQ